jgi:hypothetical protein
MATLAQVQKLREDLRNINTCIDTSAQELFGEIEEIFDREKEMLKLAIERVDAQLATLEDRGGEGPSSRPTELTGVVDANTTPSKKRTLNADNAEVVRAILNAHQRELEVLREEQCAELDQLEDAYEAELERREQAFEARLRELAAAQEQELHNAVNKARIGMFFFFFVPAN